MTSQVDNVIRIYRTLAKIPSLSGARLLQKGKIITSKWSQRNLERKTNCKISYDYFLDNEFRVIYESDVGLDTSSESFSTFSPSETFKAVVREQTESGDSKKQYLEIWQSKQLIRCIDLAALEIHGDVYTDTEFGSLQWSPDEEYVAYVAEKKIPKSEPFYKRKPIKTKKEDGSGESPPLVGKEFEYRQDWGEQLVGKYLSVVVVCHLDTESFTVLEGLPDSWCPGQIVWAPDSKSLVGVARETEPRRLGLIFCTNRPSVIFNLTLNGKYSIISEGQLATTSPRFSPDYELLVWLQRPSKGTHHGTMQLVGTRWPLQDKPVIQEIVDVVKDHVEIENNQKFYGVYCQALPGRGFTADSKRLIFTTPQQNENRTFVLNLGNRKLTDISDKVTSCSTTVLDVQEDVVLAVKSAINRPHQLIICRLPAEGEENNIIWQAVGNPSPVPQEISNLKIEYLNLKHESSEDSVNSFTAIFVDPNNKDEKPVPLIVWPHGGPHSCFINAYSLDAAMFGMLGFATLQVNYRGSVGTGENSVVFLCRKIGEADVKDCKLATDFAINKLSVKPAVGLYGGSHGGFLVTQLSGQFPDAYHAVVSRNPVIDVSTMLNTTDIPDWCTVECGEEFTEIGPMDENLISAMRKMSPIVHAHKVRAPTMLMLGSIDKRVPYFQGLEYYHKLRANGCKTKLHVYADNHSLSSVSAEMDNVINSALWFLEHIHNEPSEK